MSFKMRLLIVLSLYFAQFISVLEAQRPRYIPIERGCAKRSCYPATGNLLIGRQDKLSATSTCGLEEEERYCILSHLDISTSRRAQEKCFKCDSRTHDSEGIRVSPNPRHNHAIDKIVYRWEPAGKPRIDQYRTWWQAENGEQNVTIQLDLEAEFHVTHLIITYKTFRPKAMYIEKSFDWGKTWKITRYFAHDCRTNWPGIRKGAPDNLNEVVCQERYSRIVPSTQGTVIYRVLPPNINIHRADFLPYSKPVQDLLKTTNIRLVMTALHTLGDENLNLRDNKEKYYYSIYDMTVRGSCSCYGHADSCKPAEPEHANIEGMVHGLCECEHNTMGNNCELCKPLYNDLQWKPATGKNKNECKKCNCNEHADSCTYNEYVYQANLDKGIIGSGGVCNNCTHNTEGRQCDSCVIMYYQDPNLPLNATDICKKCDCEPAGTTDGGLCDPRTDLVEDMVAGRCHCKKFTDGPRCDQCTNGYWNFTAENPDGCQECTCDFRGIRSTAGCDMNTGDCACKANVIGRDCNQCKPEHYGLSKDDPLGCQPCDCDIGGAYDNNCDVITGQCKCRPNIEGRRCDDVPDGYFIGGLDFLVFEGELATGSTPPAPPTVVIKVAPKPAPESTPWTGIGFMQVFEGSDLTFLIPTIFRTLQYDLVVRYEHTDNFPLEWAKVSYEVISLDGPPSGECSDSPPEASEGSGEGSGNSETVTEVAENEGSGDDVTATGEFSMPPDTTQTTVSPSLCLERGKRYKIKFTFDQYDPNTPKATINIDAIALIPKANSMSIFNASHAEDEKQLIEANNCEQLFPSGTKFCTDRQIVEACKAPLKSMSMFAFEGGFARRCECDSTGSESSICDKYCGQCPCKLNVAGRTCDRCAISFYGFNADGCLPCDCHGIGALDNFCDEVTGQCKCDENAYGRRCNECEPGYWNFPNCEPCQCNGHASICEAETGECIDCRHSTTGFHCEVCLDGWFGEPTEDGLNIQCRECRCPNTQRSGHSFADKCSLQVNEDNSTEAICECQEQYKGSSCNQCNDNYYGNPETPGGSCIKCNCSGNVDLSVSGNCNPSDGKCLQCIYNTVGDHCEYCEPGYFGDAINLSCAECTCNVLGTADPYPESGIDKREHNCDRDSGVCRCLPNVQGDSCDKCIADHWHIASGEGCEPCNCDLVGSKNMTCNEYTGKCECKDEFGGRACDQCKENHWGDPKAGDCRPCDCNPEGSKSFQCDWETGKCDCLEGIGGEKCDQCDRGFVQQADVDMDHPTLNRTIPHGDIPECVACGECFSNWDRILEDLQAKTQETVGKARRVKDHGAAGAYTTKFKQLDKELEEIRDILRSASITQDELLDLQRKIDVISNRTTETTDQLDGLDDDIADVKQSIQQEQSKLDYLKYESDILTQDAQLMKDQITELQETNVEGALNLTKEARQRSQDAADKVHNIQARDGDLKQSENKRVQTNNLMKNAGISYKQTQREDQETLQDVTNKIRDLEREIPGLNQKVCDGTTTVDQPCDELCGGAGCDKCGGLSCLNGALSKAKEAVKAANNADALLIEKDGQAEDVLNDVRRAQQTSMAASNEAQAAYDFANQAKELSMRELEEVTSLNGKIAEFTSKDRATPENVKEVAEQCLAAELRLDDSTISDIANEINDAIEKVTNVEGILGDTRADLLRVQQLAEASKQAETYAKNELDKANKVTDDLSKALEAQNKADQSLQTTQTKISSAREDLAQIINDMDQATSAADASVIDVRDLKERQTNLQTEYIKNENRVNDAKEAAEDAKAKAQEANNDLYLLNTGFKNVSDTLQDKTREVTDAKDKAMDLQRRANLLSNSATNKLDNLKDIESEFESNERKLMSLSQELVKLNCEMKVHLRVIEEKSNYYRTCASGGTWEPAEACTCIDGDHDPKCTPTQGSQPVMMDQPYELSF